MALKGVPPEKFKSSTGVHTNKFQNPGREQIVVTMGQMETQKTNYEAMIDGKDKELSIMDGIIDNYKDFIEQFETVLLESSEGIHKVAEDLELAVKKNMSDKEKLFMIFVAMRDKIIEPEE